MLALTSIALSRFKAAFDPEPVDFPRLALLIGHNGSGKSTVLEALQWIDTTLRRDAREATDRYRGMADIVNLRSQTKPPYFAFDLTWTDTESPGRSLHYWVKVDATKDNAPAISEERLFLDDNGRTENYIVTSDEGRIVPAAGLTVREPDRLALGLFGSIDAIATPEAVRLRDWWANAVFLRLSPSRLAESSLARRRSFDPLLDEEGSALPALLNELSDQQRESLVEAVRDILPGMRDVQVSTEGSERNQRANYSLLERMPYRGRAGRYQFPIPAWMLSEGTRRITAILALLAHEPPPSFLCIEEFENGLDPWAVRTLLSHLSEASQVTSQVVLTTHSPWLLDDVPVDSVILVRREEGNTEYRRFAELPDVAAFDTSLPAGTRYVNVE